MYVCMYVYIYIYACIYIYIYMYTCENSLDPPPRKTPARGGLGRPQFLGELRARRDEQHYVYSTILYYDIIYYNIISYITYTHIN